MNIPTSPSQPDDGLETTTGADDHEPLIDTPAALIGAAAELLAVFDELISQRHSCCVDNQLHALLNITHPRGQGTSLATMRTTLNTTGHELAERLEDTGIWVEPSLLRPPYHGSSRWIP